MKGWVRGGRGRSGAAVGAILLGATVALPVSAALTAVNVTGQPVVVGDTVSYRALDDNAAPWPTTYAWKYRCTSNGAQGNWQDAPFATAAWSSQEQNVGNFEVKVQSAMSDGSTQTVQNSVTVSGPTTDEVNAAQLDVVMFFMMGPAPINLQFAVMNGNRKIGPYPDGYPEYKIRRPQFNLDTGWCTDTAYSLNADTIVARVAIEPADFNNGFANLADGAVVDDYYFQNRMLIRNCAGNYETFVFPERRFQKIKAGSNSWKLVEVAQ